MSKKEKYGDNVQLIKSRRLKLKKTKIFLVVMLIVLSISFAVFSFAGGVFFPDLKFSSWFSKSSVKVNKHSMYFVNMNKLTDYEEAQNLATLTTTFGASSYIWKDKDEYIIVGSAYAKKADAESIETEIKSKYPTVFVQEVVFKKLNLNYEKYTKEQRQVVKESLQLIDEIINNVYIYNNRLDKGEISPTTASSFVNGHKSESIIMSNRLDILNSTMIYESTITLKNSYVKITEILNELVLKLISADNVHQPSKYSYINLIREKYELYEKLA